jgi:Leucine-rich repeat (LRR) protein
VRADIVYNVPDSEIAALQDLYDATDGDSWSWDGAGTIWNFTNPNPCIDEWQGVTCSQVLSDGYMHVTALDLNAYGLAGSIPDSVGQLTQLVRLFLSLNLLSGSIPDSIGQLTQLATLNLNANLLSGSLPDSFQQLTQLVSALLGTNQLSGTIPDFLPQLTQLQELYLDYNRLTGTIPSSFGQIAPLMWLDVRYNELSGPIPESLQQLTLLTVLYLGDNHLTGTIPASLGSLTEVKLLDLSFNQLLGTLPQSLQQLEQLTELDIGSNQLTGTISWLSHAEKLSLGANQLTGSLPELGQFGELSVLDVQGNYLTGTIPLSIANLTVLTALSVGRNLLTGVIPATWGYAAEAITVCHLQENCLSGPIPDAMSHMPLLKSLNLSSNRLTGFIPTFQELSMLQVLMLHNNQLRGNADGLFNPAQQVNLSTVQLSGNQLTGTLPAATFLLPSLSSFAAVGNCFEGPLPEEAICSSVSLSALVLDGLHSAKACKRTASASHTAFKLGPLPSCLLSMPSLATLHLSGSGLTGSLPSEANISAVLTDLSLSHNLLTGSIPESILERDWNKLDLSYNRLTGTLHSAGEARFSNATKLILQLNRLSGVIPGSMQRVDSLTILENNMFSCQADRSDVPQHDTDSDKYSCGSDAVNNALYAWLGAAVGVTTAAAGLAVYRSQSAEPFYGSWLRAARNTKLCLLQGLFQLAHVLCALGAGCAAYCILVLLPVYAAVDSYDPSFTYKYAWTVSGVFLSGATAFVLEAVFLLLQLPICAYVAERLLSRMGTASQHNTGGEASAVARSTTVTPRQTVVNIAVMMLSLTVVTGINVAFVFATLNLTGRELTVIQILLAVFKLGFNNYAAPALRNRVKAVGVGHEITASQLLLVLLNVIVIPCLVVLFISPACFYDALRGPDSVTSSYVYGGSCLKFFTVDDMETHKITVECVDVQSELGTTSYTPAFTYSYQCSSSFVTYYAPTFVIMCIISGFLVPAYNLMLLQLRRSLPPTSRMYAMVNAATPRILRELRSPQDLAQARSNPLYRPVFVANKLVMSLLTYLALLLTFGALFPPLAVCCAVAMASVVLTARLEVGRYVSAAVAVERQDCLNEVETACAGVATPQQLRLALYLVLTVSCLFYTLFLFDTLGYEVGFAGAFWVLIVVPLLPVVARALYSAAARTRGRGAVSAVNTRKTEHNPDPEAGTELPALETVTVVGAMPAEPARSEKEALTTSANPLHDPL